MNDTLPAPRGRQGRCVIRALAVGAFALTTACSDPGAPPADATLTDAAPPNAPADASDAGNATEPDTGEANDDGRDAVDGGAIDDHDVDADPTFADRADTGDPGCATEPVWPASATGFDYSAAGRGPNRDACIESFRFDASASALTERGCAFATGRTVVLSTAQSSQLTALLGELSTVCVHRPCTQSFAFDAASTSFTIHLQSGAATTYQNDWVGCGSAVPEPGPFVSGHRLFDDLVPLLHRIVDAGCAGDAGGGDASRCGAEPGDAGLDGGDAREAGP